MEACGELLGASPSIAGRVLSVVSDAEAFHSSALRFDGTFLATVKYHPDVRVQELRVPTVLDKRDGWLAQLEDDRICIY
jgi:hypothetical protein